MNSPLYLDIMFIICLNKFGTDKTIEYLELESIPKFKEYITADMKERRCDLFHTRRVISIAEQVSIIKKCKYMDDDFKSDIMKYTYMFGLYKGSYFSNEDYDEEYYDAFDVLDEKPPRVEGVSFPVVEEKYIELMKKHYPNLELWKHFY